MSTAICSAALGASQGSLHINVSGNLPDPLRVNSLTLEVSTCDNDSSVLSLLGTNKWQPTDATVDFHWREAQPCPITIRLDDNREEGHFVVLTQCVAVPDRTVPCSITVTRIK